jgi:hypothetical protein
MPLAAFRTASPLEWEEGARNMAKVIMGIQLNRRQEDAKQVQELLTRSGCSITTRLGLHGATKDSCSPRGLILLEFVEGADEEIAALETELAKFDSVDVKKMVFE